MLWPLSAEWMVSRLEIPGFDSRSKRISRSVSVTADLIRLAITDGESSSSIRPLGDDADLLILAVGSCRSKILAVPRTMCGSGTTKVLPVSYTHLRAHETRHDLVCRLLLEKKKNNKKDTTKGIH